MNFLLVFFVLSIVNVIFATTKSLVTIKGNKLTAALVSGGYYAFYNIMLIYIVTDFPIWQKCIVTFICNVIGVFVVKWFEEKTQKEKLWKVELTVPTEYLEVIDKCPVAHSYIMLSNKHTLFNFYCDTKYQTEQVKELADHYDAKYFASESKSLY